MIDPTTLDIIRLLVFSCFGLAISYTDIRFGKIYNSHLLCMAFAGAILFILPGSIDLVSSLAINLFLSLLAGVILWKMNIWGAGDSKLYTISSLYLPAQAHLTFFSNQIVLVNIFILAFFIWLFPLIFRTTLREKKLALKYTLSKGIIIEISLAIFGLFYFITKFFSYFDIGLYSTGYIITLFLSMSIYLIFKRLFSRWALIIITGLCIVRIFLDSSIILPSFWEIYLLSVFAILLTMYAGNLSLYISCTEKKINQIKKGDVPIGIITRKPEDKSLKSFLNNHFGEDNNILRTGFSEKDIQSLKKMHDLEGFLVKTYLRFTPIILLSFLLFAFLGRDLLLYIFSIFIA